MRFSLFLAASAIALAALPVQADTAQQTSMKNCAATWKAMSATDKGKSKYTDYMGTCMKGASAATKTAGGTTATAPAPATSMMMTAKPASGNAMTMAAHAGGQAKCKDGKVVTYKSRQGTCSGHGGVASWM